MANSTWQKLQIDEGKRLMIACNSYDPTSMPTQNAKHNETNTNCKSQSFQRDSGQFYFKRKCHRVTKDALEQKEDDRIFFQLII